jgi:predicted MPP superfamily phosphohydrolase
MEEGFPVSTQAGMAELTRRRFMGLGLGFGAFAGLGLGGYSSFVEPQELVVERIPLKLPRLPEAFHGLKIALISDLHLAPFTGEKEIRAAVAVVNGLGPDIVAVTGDFISGTWDGSPAHARFIEPCSRILEGLQAPLGRYAVLGNHDHGTDPVRVSNTLEAHRIPVLSNRNLPLEKDGARLWIAGLDDAVYRKADFECALDGIPANEAVVLLAHEPDVADESARYKVDLQLSGHSHGGQVRVPGIGAPYFPPLARKYPTGLYHIGPTQLYTNRGIGLSGVPFRFACPPEVTLLELSSAS